ncbi:phage tail tube protein [Devosia aurantiaca]|uniref:Histidine kinase n=1 Tax=Devosia aurantiaca TaxID=2714858 RepID=A0A6M1SPZ3_9HYPH|nr:phage tail tube protein [Devosia aurantiaca]NGP19298.1 histidine kinase [Devosia aurantiaca]
MTETGAMLGYGSTLELAPFELPNAFEYVAEVKNFTLPSDTTDQQDVSHMQSPNKTREFIDGFSDPGEFGCEMNYIPGSPSDTLLIAAKGKRKRIRITFPNGVQVLFTGSRQSYEKTAETENAMTASVSFKVSGEPLQTPVTAPRALVAPLLRSSTTPPQVGSVVELDQGIWAGARYATVQWQVDGVDVVGATGSAYVPVAADVGKPITAVVTGGNDDFETVVTTAETADVVAAT